MKILKDINNWTDKTRCPICNSKLIKKYEGMVCKNYNCPLYFKLGKGWAYIIHKENPLKWTLKYDFDLERHENIKKWLLLKSQIIYEKGCCEICGSIKKLQVHHILPRCSNPELNLDKDNLMVLCEDCHKKIHENDKYRFN
jgi:5-methylcytosine-specific restriction endonuclease McrA